MTDFALTRDWLAARTAASPAALALIEDGGEWTYGALDRLVDQTTAWLREQGVTPGGRVGVLLPNSLAYVALIHALTRAGAILVALNTRLTTAELVAQLEQADCSFVVTTVDRAPLLITAQRPVVVLTIESDLAAIRNDQQRAVGGYSPAESGLNQIQVILFTSGTTGRPKAAMVSYSNHFYSAVGSAFRLGVLPTDRWLACMPLYHVGGLAIILRACLYGTAVVLHAGFDVNQVDASLRKQQVSIVSLVPTMLQRMLRSSDPRQWPAMRLVLLGGAAVEPDILAAARSAGLPVATTYGLTEAASQVATMTPDQANHKPGCVGRPLLFSELRIVDDDGQPVAAGTIGEICVRGPNVFAGYYHDDDADQLALRSGELHTGDLGYLDDDGDLWVVQRRSDLIVSGGENVYPAEVEQVLANHPAVSAVCVVGLGDPEWGQQVAALVVADTTLTAADLEGFARQSLAGYKVPRTILFADALPLTGSGKVSRSAVRDAFRQTQEWPT